MIIKYCFKGLEKREEDFVGEYMPKKVDSIEKRLSHFSTDAVVLMFNVSRFEKHNAYCAEFVLKLPNKTIVAKEASHTLNKAIDFAKNRLLRQIAKHDASLKKEYLFDREHGGGLRKEAGRIGTLSAMTEEVFI